MLRALSYFRRWSLDIGGLFSNFYVTHLMYICGQCGFTCLCILCLLTNGLRTVFYHAYLICIKCAGYVKFVGGARERGLLGI